MRFCTHVQEHPESINMKKLIQRILELEKISNELEPSEVKRNEYLQQIQDYANWFINNIEKTKAYSDKKVKQGVLSLNGNKNPLSRLIKVYANEVVDKGINAASGGHIGYVPGGGIYISALADYLAAVTNEYAGLFYASPGAVTIENEILNWMKSIFGFPEDAAGTLTSGGSIANLIALTAARDHHKIKSDTITKSVVYLSPQTHHCINKALKIIGLEDVILRYSDLDRNSRINAEKLNQQINKDKTDGLNPFLIIGTAGTTDTGAVDPLMEIGEIARINNLWYHIDAAYGGFFILSREKKDIFKGIEKADSLVTDPHKGLFIPYGSGAVLVKNKEAITHSHQYTANYLQDSARNITDMYDPADVSPELTRHFRALRIWLPLQIHGLEPFIACLDEKLLLTAYFRNKLEEIGFKTGPVPDLSISYFWYPSIAIGEDIFNKKLLELIHKDGNVFFSSTIINGKFVIRMAVLSFRTKLRTIDRAIEIINNSRLKLEKEFNLG
jgi:aromatic-L-amino-acid/L-tryptophan decarboxylase